PVSVTVSAVGNVGALAVTPTRAKLRSGPNDAIVGGPAVRSAAVRGSSLEADCRSVRMPAAALNAWPVTGSGVAANRKSSTIRLSAPAVSVNSPNIASLADTVAAPTDTITLSSAAARVPPVLIS